MNWKELLLNLGTPVVETLIANEFEKIVVFQRDENGLYVVIESKGVIPKKSVYGSEEEITSEFPDMKLVRVTNSTFYLIAEDHPEMEVFRRVESLSERIRSIEGLESRITRHIYQLQGMDTVVSSLLEPIPTEILLSMVMDAISELFVTSVALYRLVDEEYVLFTSLGPEDFPDSLPGELRDSTKISGLVEAEQVLGSKGLLLTISEETENVYVLYLKRGESFTPEEKALLESITKIISRTREYMKSKERIADLDRLLNQARFVVESLGEFSQSLLTTHSISDLERMIVDMLREMLQSSWAAMYRRSGDELLLIGKASVVSGRDFPEKMRILKDLPRSFKEKPEGYIEGFPKDTWFSSFMKLENLDDYVVLFGPPITEEMILGDIFEIYVDIVLSSVEKAFESIRLYEEVKTREERISKLHESLKNVARFVKELRRLKEPSKVYELLFEYVSENLGISGMVVRIEGFEMELGHPEGKALSVQIEEAGERVGEIEYFRKGDFDPTDSAILETLTEGVLSTLRTMYLMLPSQMVVNSEEVILRFLREKGVVHGMSEENMRFFKITGFESPEILEDLGVAVVENGGAILVTEMSPEELKKRGLNVEEV